MAGGFDDENGKFRVLVNEEEQYSCGWMAWRFLAAGLTPASRATKRPASTNVGKVWTDMRPKSLRVWMEEHAKANRAGVHKRRQLPKRDHQCSCAVGGAQRWSVQL